MTRHLFALLALLSGLAALSGPAAASFAHATTSCDASVSASADEARGAQQAQVRTPLSKVPSAEEAKPAERRVTVPQSLGGPVLMGVDRAYE